MCDVKSSDLYCIFKLCKKRKKQVFVMIMTNISSHEVNIEYLINGFASKKMYTFFTSLNEIRGMSLKFVDTFDDCIRRA